MKRGAWRNSAGAATCQRTLRQPSWDVGLSDVESLPRWTVDHPQEPGVRTVGNNTYIGIDMAAPDQQQDDVLLSVSTYIRSGLLFSILLPPPPPFFLHLARKSTHLPGHDQTTNFSYSQLHPNPPSKLQSSLRNALNTFGPDSKQYATVKSILDEYVATAALQALCIAPSGAAICAGHDEAKGDAMDVDSFRTGRGG